MSSYPPNRFAFETMANHLPGAVSELFEAYGSSVDLRAGAEAATSEVQQSMAVIGFAGKGMRGALVLIATEASVCAWMNAAGLTCWDVADTLGEFSNMLLGRLKVRISAEGIALFATTPTTATGNGLRLSYPPCQCSWSKFEGPGWDLDVRLDAEFEPDFEMHRSRRVSKPAQPGDFIDFDLMAEESPL